MHSSAPHDERISCVRRPSAPEPGVSEVDSLQGLLLMASRADGPRIVFVFPHVRICPTAEICTMMTTGGVQRVDCVTNSVRNFCAQFVQCF